MSGMVHQRKTSRVASSSSPNRNHSNIHPTSTNDTISNTALRQRRKRGRFGGMTQQQQQPSPVVMIVAVLVSATGILVVLTVVLVLGWGVPLTGNTFGTTSSRSFRPNKRYTDTTFPRVVQIITTPDDNGGVTTPMLAAQPMDAAQQDDDDLNNKNAASIRKVRAMSSIARQRDLKDSKEYGKRLNDEWETKECRAMRPWQLTQFPNCNVVHEVTDWNLGNGPGQDNNGNHDHSTTTTKYLTNGFWRDVWSTTATRTITNTTVSDTTAAFETVVIKTLRPQHEVTARNFDRNRRDALVMERLTFSPWVLDIYGFCANTGLSEFAPGGDIEQAIWGKDLDSHTAALVNNTALTPRVGLIIATQAALGLAAMHSFDSRASVAHTDISPGQWVKVGDRYKLNDFNRARFLRVNVKDNTTCSFTVPKNPGKNRSPEEYVSHGPESEKVDIYSLGNIFYMLLQKRWPFLNDGTKEARILIQKGYRPKFDKDVWYSKDKYVNSLKKAMIMCHEQEPKDRASAVQVADFLKQELERHDPGVLASWGESVG